jgi:hypothetical protein
VFSIATIAVGPGGAPTVERLAIEQSLTGALSGLATTTGGRERVACATTGHGELPWTPTPDHADWALVADRLRAEGFAIAAVTIVPEVPARCDVLIVAGPATPLSPAEALAIQNHVRAGRGLLVAGSLRALTDGRGSTGLAGVLSAEGLGIPAAIAVDPDATVREAPGAILVDDGYADAPAGSSIASSINAGFARARFTLWQPRPVIVDGDARALVHASAASWGERDLETSPPTKSADDLGGPVVLAAVGGGAARPEHPTRVIAIGAAETFASSVLSSGGLANGLWLARVVRWLSGDQPREAAIAARAPNQVRLVLDDGERRAIKTVSVAGIPLAWLGFGGLWILVRRRRAARSVDREKSS